VCVCMWVLFAIILSLPSSISHHLAAAESKQTNPIPPLYALYYTGVQRKTCLFPEETNQKLLRTSFAFFSLVTCGNGMEAKSATAVLRRMLFHGRGVSCVRVDWSLGGQIAYHCSIQSFLIPCKQHLLHLPLHPHFT
jgi:hypothetical protein